jgi:hypothetical protein
MAKHQMKLLLTILTSYHPDVTLIYLSANLYLFRKTIAAAIVVIILALMR